MGKKSKKIAFGEAGNQLSANPFGALESSGLPRQSIDPVEKPVAMESTERKRSRGRVDVVRQRSAGSAGWSTIVKNFVGISTEEKNALKKTIQKRCGVGGTLKSGCIEIQGDKRDQVREVLEAAGFRVVFAGG